MSTRTRNRRAPRVIAIAATGVCMLLGAPAAASAACAGEELEVSDQNTVALEESILCLINERRASSGVGPVRLNAKLAQAASRHSNDMVSQGFFSHTSPGGGTFISRIASTGYTRGARSWLVGENLAWGSGSLSTPANLVEAWMESPAHRANLLRGRFREVGLSGVRGTPSDSGDQTGVTVSSEYGYRAVKKSARKSRKARGRRS
jgi:uncharacterized protein YkwD